MLSEACLSLLSLLPPVLYPASQPASQKEGADSQLTKQWSLAPGHFLVQEDSQGFQRNWQDSVWAVLAHRKLAAGKESRSEEEGKRKHSRPCRCPPTWPPWCGAQFVHLRWEQCGGFLTTCFWPKQLMEGGGRARGDWHVWSHTPIKGILCLKNPGSRGFPSGRHGATEDPPGAHRTLPEPGLSQRRVWAEAQRGRVPARGTRWRSRNHRVPQAGTELAASSAQGAGLRCQPFWGGSGRSKTTLSAGSSWGFFLWAPSSRSTRVGYPGVRIPLSSLAIKERSGGPGG